MTTKAKPGDRWRLVNNPGGSDEFVGTVVMTASEAIEHVKLEAEMHERGGWAVALVVSDAGASPVMVARRPDGRTRTVTARRYGALTDTQVGAASDRGRVR